MNKGFTLIEIIVVLIIAGVLAAIAVPAYFSWVNKSRLVEGLQKIKTMQGEVRACTLAKGDDYVALQACTTPILDRYNMLYPSPYYNFAMGAGSNGSDWQYYSIVLIGSDTSLSTTITYYKNGNTNCASNAGIC